jgi:hypothetical protein
MLIEFLNEVADNLTILFSISILLFSFILTIINWKILQVSKTIRDISMMLLSETVVIKQESVRVRVVSEEVLEETIRLRQSLGDIDEERS